MKKITTSNTSALANCPINQDGRGAVEKKILDRMVDDLQYMTDHQEQSATAKRTISQHKKKMESRAYPTIMELYKFSLTTADVRCDRMP
jgi:hypothetical protein